MKFNFEENRVVAADKFETVVPEDFRGLYAESDEGYALRMDDPGVGAAIKAIGGLNTALTAARGEAKAAKGQKVDLSALADYGSTPEEIAEAVQERLKTASKGKSEDLDRMVTKIKEDLAKSHAEEITNIKASREALKGQLYQNLVVSEATKALAEAGVIDADLVLPMLEKQVGVSEDDGKFSVLVLDGAGDPRYSGVTGNPMSIKELVAEMKANEKYGPLFRSEQKTGGGKPPLSGRTQQTQGDLSPTAKIAAGLGKGQAQKRR